jgi:hypothetical protein
MNMRVISSIANVFASPEAPLARLHTATLIPHKSHREYRSASHPKTGAKTM